MAEDKFDSGDVLSLLPWQVTVRNAQFRESAAQILQREDADSLIKGLSELEAYYAIKSSGVEDAGPLLLVIEHEQIRTLFDLEGWRDFGARLSDLLVWLRGFQEVDRLEDAVAGLDPELFALLLRRRLLICTRESEDEDDQPPWSQDPPEEIQPLVITPDRRFVIAARAFDETAEHGADDPSESEPIDAEERKQILEIVEVLYRSAEYEKIAASLFLASADLSSDLEETALHFRTARLEDLGFPPLERALNIYQRVDPSSVLAGTPDPDRSVSLKLPGLYLRRFSQGLFRAALESITSVDLIRSIEGELVALANSVLVADRVEPGNLETIESCLERARGYLDIALAFSVPPEDALKVAGHRLEHLGVRTLFQLGFSVTLDLSRRAAALRSSQRFAFLADPFGLLEDGDRGLLRALLDDTRPLYADPDRRTPPRAFRDFSEIEHTAAKLLELEALAAVEEILELRKKSEGLSGRIDPPAPERTLEALLCTFVARLVVDPGGKFSALDGGELEALRRLSAGTGSESQHIADRALEALKSAWGDRLGLHLVTLAPRIRRGFEELEETLGSLREGPLDPRFVGVVLRRIDRPVT